MRSRIRFWRLAANGSSGWWWGGGEEIRPITGQHKAMEPHTNGHFQDREMDPEVSKVSKCNYNYGKEVDPELGT